MIKVLVDGRVNGADGIGRYTRQLIASLNEVAPPEFDISVLEETSTARYTRREGAELARAAETIGVDIVHALDYRTPIEYMKAALVVTVHDVFRATDPYLCYDDERFAEKFGPESLAELKRLTASIKNPVPIKGSISVTHHGEFYRRMLVHSCSRADSVVVPTQSVAENLFSILDTPPVVTVSHFGVDHLDSVETNVSPIHTDGAPYFLYVGQARAHKGIDLLLTAYLRSRAPYTGVRLVFAGRDFKNGTIASKSVDAALGGKAVRVGEIEDGDLVGLYRRALALIHLSQHEGFGFTPLEALSLGARVVVRDVAVLRETLGSHARFCSEDSQEIAELLNRLVSSPDTREARNRRRSWAGRYRWRDHAESMIALYRNVLE